MANEGRFDIPFIPQTGITSQILTAIQLANEQARSQQQLAIQRQQAGVAQQTAQAQIEEAKARSGFYGSEAQLNQLKVDNIKRMQGLFGTGQQMPAQPQGQPAQPQGGPWLPTGTPQNLGPMIAPMLPGDLSDQEKNVIESASAGGKMKANEAPGVSL